MRVSKSFCRIEKTDFGGTFFLSLSYRKYPWNIRVDGMDILLGYWIFSFLKSDLHFFSFISNNK